jgi:hypothetical protein
LSSSKMLASWLAASLHLSTITLSCRSNGDFRPKRGALSAGAVSRHPMRNFVRSTSDPISMWLSVAPVVDYSLNQHCLTFVMSFSGIRRCIYHEL